MQILAFWEDNSAEIFLPTVEEKLKLFNRPFFRPAAERKIFLGLECKVMKQKDILGNGILKSKEVKRKDINNFMIVSAFSRKDSYDRRYLKRILSQ